MSCLRMEVLTTRMSVGTRVCVWQLSKYICQVYLVNEHVCNANKITLKWHTHTIYIYICTLLCVTTLMEAPEPSGQQKLILCWAESQVFHIMLDLVLQTELWLRCLPTYGKSSSLSRLTHAYIHLNGSLLWFRRSLFTNPCQYSTHTVVQIS